MAALPEGTVTFLFSDVEGSTRLLERHGAEIGSALARHHALFEEVVERHNGAIFETVGDAVYAAFALPTDAAAAALDAHRALAAEDWGPIGRLAVRIAVHTGVVERRGDHYFGSPLFRAARLLALALGEQTLISGVTAALVVDALPDGASLRDLGIHRLKDLGAPEDVHQLVHRDLRVDFPPLRSLDAHPHNLPVQLSSFVGREAELAEVAALLDTHRLVTLLGPGGIGKTRLALQVAADRLERHPDGVFFVDLASTREPEFVPSTIATTLGLHEQPGRTIDQLLHEHLADRQLLLVLDNLEQLLPAIATAVAQLLAAAPKLHLLATSRAPVRVRGEREYAVPSLATGSRDRLDVGPPPAVALFAERARELHPDFAVDDTTGPIVADVCARLDGLPLAIELAVARLRVFDLDALRKRLAQRLPLLAGGSRDLPERQQTLRDTIAWSEELLDEPERRLFARIGAFAGSFNLEAVEAVCGPELQTDPLAGLETLVAHSLVRRAEPGPGPETRFSLLETIREYAAERLEASGEAEEIRRRHAHHYLLVAEASETGLHGPHQVELFARMEADHDNLRRSLESSIDHRDVDTAIRLTAALCWFWTLRNYYREGRAWCARILSVASDAPAGQRAKVQLTDGTLAAWQGSPREAMSILREALEAFSADGNGSGAARALCWLAEAAADLEQVDEADRYYARGLELARTSGDVNAHRWLTGNRALVLAQRGQIAAARDAWMDTLRSSEAVGDTRSIMVALANIGALDYVTGNLSSAESLLVEAFQRAKILGMPDDCAEGAASLARLQVETGACADAGKTLLQALEEGWVPVGERATAVWIDACAAWASAVGDHPSAARLWGVEAVANTRPELGSLYRDKRAQTMAAARVAIGAADFNRLLAEGRRMSVEDAARAAAELLRRSIG